MVGLFVCLFVCFSDVRQHFCLVSVANTIRLKRAQKVQRMSDVIKSFLAERGSISALVLTYLSASVCVQQSTIRAPLLLFQLLTVCL